MAEQACCTLLIIWILSVTANSQDVINATLFGTWGVEQFNYSCDADASGKRMAGHRPLDFNTVSFTNWNGVFKAWTADWVVMSGKYSPNGTFSATGKVGVNANDTSGTACALTSKITGWFNESDASWEATLLLDYSLLCWGCQLDESGCPYERSVPLRSSRYLAAPKPLDPPVLLTPPSHLQGLMVEWPVNTRNKCGLLNLAITSVKFSNVNFSSILLTANTSLGSLPLRGRYQVENDTFSASASFPVTVGGQCSALVQVKGQVQFADNSSCAEEHNVSLVWSANVTMLVFGSCAQCTQLQFALAPFNCSSPSSSSSNNANNTNNSSDDETNSSTAAPSLAPSTKSPTVFILAGLDRSFDGSEGDSFIPGVPLWAACVIVGLIFLCCVVACVCLFLTPTWPPKKRGNARQPVGPGAEQEHLVEEDTR